MEAHYRLVQTVEELSALLHNAGEEISEYTFLHVDFTAEAGLSLQHRYTNCIFIACTMPDGIGCRVSNCFSISKMRDDIPYRATLYSPHDLYKGYILGQPDSYNQTFDLRVYRRFLEKGKTTTDTGEVLARVFHDHSITISLCEFVKNYPNIVGIMGGHAMERTSPHFAKCAELGKILTEQGYLTLTGGGPGAMEATHLGAWMAGRRNEELADAINTLKAAPNYSHHEWINKAIEVMKRYPQHKYCSLGIPTWYYGHERTAPFATHIAKYFDNSIREDHIVSLCNRALVIAPGGAGTLQEIFQETCICHYKTLGRITPMIFLNIKYWTEEMPIWPMMQDMIKREKLHNMKLHLVDEPIEVLDILAKQ